MIFQTFIVFTDFIISAGRELTYWALQIDAKPTEPCIKHFLNPWSSFNLCIKDGLGGICGTLKERREGDGEVMKVEPGFLSESDHCAISLESLSSLTGLLDLNDRAEHRFFVGFSTFSS